MFPNKALNWGCFSKIFLQSSFVPPLTPQFGYLSLPHNSKINDEADKNKQNLIREAFIGYSGSKTCAATQLSAR